MKPRTRKGNKVFYSLEKKKILYIIHIFFGIFMLELDLSLLSSQLILTFILFFFKFSWFLHFGIGWQQFILVSHHRLKQEKKQTFFYYNKIFYLRLWVGILGFLYSCEIWILECFFFVILWNLGGIQVLMMKRK